ncbi:monovalent cation/H+ antiporter subunit D [Sulfurospirillum sp. T05]|uniref:Monovalent cation/H+ antiporter subunit D n=1 Tax=Sulfurospirillum tamanense TaxID=2813362 RepID=A0ABS2WV87_9BACT|nr:monovalent cation/H+ antiporter subunit D [Sulfurospirillum tamanensis]MBN2965566.1 monovalent cation/H+ antiporter subunit D [Sulfurospirillum tamanensis]
MMHSAILPILLPLFGAIAILFAKVLSHKAQQMLSIMLMFLLVILNIWTISTLANTGHVAYQLGNWIAPFGITLVLDSLSATMVLLTSVLAFGALWYAIITNIDGKNVHFHVLFHLQLFGINGAFLTGDVFNLFVFFEILLLASYSLLLHGHGKERTKASLHYVIINLVGSTLFLFAVGALYGILGTLNIADMALKISTLSPDNVNVVAGAGLLLLLVFGLKAAMFPLYFWLPGAYSHTSAPVAALFAIMTKVGVYSIIRVHGTLFGSEAGSLSFYHLPWVLFFGLITLVLATFGVMSAKALKEQVAYLVLASVATLLVALGINTSVSLGGALYYMLHSTLVAGGFFLLADNISNLREKYSDAIVQTPPFKKMIFAGSLFFAFAVGMAGMPPLSGFFGKMMILQGALESTNAGMVYFVVLLTGLFVIISLTRTGSLLFYDTDKEQSALTATVKTSHFLPALFLLAMSVGLVLFANPISGFLNETATMLYDTKGYIELVLQPMMEGQ